MSWGNTSIRSPKFMVGVSKRQALENELSLLLFLLQYFLSSWNLELNTLDVFNKLLFHIRGFCSLSYYANRTNAKLDWFGRKCLWSIIIWDTVPATDYEGGSSEIPVPIYQSTDLLKVGCGCMDWLGLAQDRDIWRALVNAVMNLRIL
jgi:hypothetical protein